VATHNEWKLTFQDLTLGDLPEEPRIVAIEFLDGDEGRGTVVQLLGAHGEKGGILVLTEVGKSNPRSFLRLRDIGTMNKRGHVVLVLFRRMFLIRFYMDFLMNARSARARLEVAGERRLVYVARAFSLRKTDSLPYFLVAAFRAR